MSIEKIAAAKTELEELTARKEKLLNELFVLDEQMEITHVALQSLLAQSNSGTVEFLQSWKTWANKPASSFKDIANVEDYFQPPKAWKDLKIAIMNKKGYKWFDTQDRTWNWRDELAGYFKQEGFVNAPLPDAEMRTAMQCIMKYNVLEHYEQGYPGDW